MLIKTIIPAVAALGLATAFAWATQSNKEAFKNRLAIAGGVRTCDTVTSSGNHVQGDGFKLTFKTCANGVRVFEGTLPTATAYELRIDEAHGTYSLDSKTTDAMALAHNGTFGARKAETGFTANSGTVQRILKAMRVS